MPPTVTKIKKAETKKFVTYIYIYIYIYNCLCGSVAKASDTQSVGHVFEPRPDH